MRPLIHFLSLLLLCLSSSALAQDIRIQGRTGVGIWRTISDGDLNPNQDVVEFGNVDFGESETRRYRIQNRTNRSITIRAISSNDAAYTFPNFPSNSFNLPRNNNFDFEIRFSPTALVQDATILLRSTANSPADFYNFGVTGNGRGPEIQLSGRIGIGNQPWVRFEKNAAVSSARGTDFGTRTTSGDFGFPVDFRIENLGNQALNLQGATITGTGAGAFLLDLDENPNISPGNRRDFEIRGGGPNPGTYSAVVNIPNNDADEDPFTFPIRITLVPRPLIALRRVVNGIRFPVPNFRAAPATNPISIGETTLGETRSLTFEITNPGNGDLDISAVTSSDNDFTVLQFPMRIRPREVGNLVIRFTPSSVSTIESFFSIVNNSNSPDRVSTAPFTFELRGVGTPAPDPARLRVLSTSGTLIPAGSTAVSTSLGNDFGTFDAGEGSVLKNFVLFNDGALPLSISEISQPSSPFSFAGEVNLPITIEPGETALFRMAASFRRNPQTYNDSVTFTSNDPENPTYAIPLRLTLSEPPPPVIESFVIQESRVVLRYLGALSVTYQVQQSATLRGDSWTPIPGFEEVSSLSINIIELPRAAGAEKMFYRVVRPDEGDE